ncbi:MAG: RloB family protein [Anaerolineales bacterium]|jgi:hypothetical protein
MTERRKFSRKSGLRDSHLVVIAAEGEETEKAYFDGIKGFYPNPRIHVEVLPRMDSASDPLRVLKLLDEFRSIYKLRRGHDQLWLVIDVDRWGNRKLAYVCRLCFQKRYQEAVSNPSFEIWLILHIRSLDTYSSQVQAELLSNNRINNRTRLDDELLNLLGSYNKVNPDMNTFGPLIFTAIQNACNADHHPDNRWPNELGTRVYLLAKEIIPELDGEKK